MDKRASARERGYTKRWEHARKGFLAKHPLCVMCQEDGRITPATVVDHIVPHRGDMALFWDVSNWAPLCASHHSSRKQREEKSGIFGCDADGRPLDPQHEWRKT